MSPTIVAAIISALAAVIAAIIGLAVNKKKEKYVQKERWYTRWAFAKPLHEVLQIQVDSSGIVTGTRTTTAEGSEPNTFRVKGHKQHGSYWLEYEKEDGHGGGAITLHMYTPGKLMGLVTSVDCDATTLLCRVNRWLPYEERSDYKPKWCETVARVAMPTAVESAA